MSERQKKENKKAEYIAGLTRLALGGDASACKELGEVYYFGSDAERNEALAEKYFLLAAEGGETDAYNSLGDMCYYSEDEEVRARAAEYYIRGVECDNGTAFLNLGVCYEEGLGLEQSEDKALECYLAAAERDCAEGYVCAGNIMCGRKDFASAEKYYELAARGGDSRGAYNLGIMFSREESCLDGEKALYWFRRSAGLGGVGAYWQIGSLYYDGALVGTDKKAAAVWYKKGAELGDADCITSLAICHKNGEGVRRDMDKAFELFKKAAKLGHAVAQAYLAQCYQRGVPVKRDYKKALRWYTAAGEGGFVNAYNNVGLAYQQGLAVQPDNQFAVECYKKAIKGGCVQAYHNLAICYELGLGVERDLKQAAKLYQKAVKGGVKESFIGLVRVLKAIEDEKNARS